MKKGILAGLILAIALGAGCARSPRVGDTSNIEVKMSVMPKEPWLGDTLTVSVKVRALNNDVPDAEVVFSGHEVSDTVPGIGSPKREMEEWTFTPSEIKVPLKKGSWKEVRSKAPLPALKNEITVTVSGTHSEEVPPNAIIPALKKEIREPVKGGRIFRGERLVSLREYGHDFGGDRCRFSWNDRTLCFDLSRLAPPRTTVVQAPPKPKPENLLEGPYIAWEQVPGSGIAGYLVYRATEPDTLNYKRITAALVPTMQYQDSGIQRGKTYRYYVTAVDTLGVESAPSNCTAIYIP